MGSICSCGWILYNKKCLNTECREYEMSIARNKWWDAKPGSVIWMTEKEFNDSLSRDTIAHPMFTVNKPKEKETGKGMELRIEGEQEQVKEVVTLKLEKDSVGNVRLVATSELGIRKTLLAVSEQGVRRIACCAGIGFDTDHFGRVNLVGE